MQITEGARRIILNALLRDIHETIRVRNEAIEQNEEDSARDLYLYLQEQKKVYSEVFKSGDQNVYCFTFGQSHTHPVAHYPMRSFWVEVHGTFEEARDKMVKVYSNKWAMQYLRSEFDPSYYTQGCHETIP